MGIANREALKQFQLLMDDGDLTYLRFRLLMDCLNWRIQNEIDNILAKPIVPPELYRSVRDSQLVGLCGYSKEGLPVIAVGVGQSTFDKASVLDMTGLKLSALNQVKLLTVISTIDDLNYPEKTDAYYIVNVPYVFSACWMVVKPLLQERTRRKIEVMDSLPHFCRKERSGSSRHAKNGNTENCFSLDSAFHQQLYSYIQQQGAVREPIVPIKQRSFHVDFPEPDPRDLEIAKTIETEFHKLENHNELSYSTNGLHQVNGEL
ncbi:hypothetical protein SDJN02_23208, partial [Cucurbita argyrosperma subsp. argyrosperma]